MAGRRTSTGAEAATCGYVVLGAPADGVTPDPAAAPGPVAGSVGPVAPEADEGVSPGAGASVADGGADGDDGAAADDDAGGAGGSGTCPATPQAARPRPSAVTTPASATGSAGR
ncbi:MULTISPECIES: hypothetical protein [unclassified Ornithinimicrobium]|uniref:hypothetical protein n=1 Tax=unclassified Ornithinimicrobium TaxID=2615080 RepID=UPI00385418E6